MVSLAHCRPGSDGLAARAARLSVQSPRVRLGWSPEDYRAALSQADSGSLRLAADFVAFLRTDGRVAGTLEQRTLGMLSLPSHWEPADPAWSDAERQWSAVFPEAEQSELLAWGVLLGIGIARVETELVHGRIERRIRTWHMRHFSERRYPGRDPEIIAHTDQGERVVRPGEGWVIYRPFGACQPWQRGVWTRLAVPVLAKTYAVDDRSRAGEVTPLLVASTRGLTETQRADLLRDLRGLANDSRVVLPEDCSLGVVDRTGGTQASIHAETIEWANTEIATAIAGQIVTTEGTAGFSSGAVQRAVLVSILHAQEETFSTAIGEQALTPWLRLAHGYRGETVYPRWDVADPSALAAQADAATKLASAIDPLDAALAREGRRVDVTALLAATRVPTTDLALAGATGPTDPLPTPPAGDVGPVVAASALPDDAPAEGDAPDPAGALAERMTELGVLVCEHGRSNRCPLCGVERERELLDAGEDGRGVWGVRWRPIA